MTVSTRSPHAAHRARVWARAQEAARRDEIARFLVCDHKHPIPCVTDDDLLACLDCIGHSPDGIDWVAPAAYHQPVDIDALANERLARIEASHACSRCGCSWSVRMRTATRG